jgi:hypothetical protein
MEDKFPCNGLSFCTLVSSIVIEIKILLINQMQDHFVLHFVYCDMSTRCWTARW